MFRAAIVALVVLVAVPCMAQQRSNVDRFAVREAPECTPAGTWYGGSVTAYQMTIVPSLPANHFTVMFQGFYKNAVMNTVLTGELVKKGDAYEGTIMQLTTPDTDFLNPPPVWKMPDIAAGVISIRMDGCNTIKNTIPMFGLYFGSSVWSYGFTGPEWKSKTPLIDSPDVNLLDVISGGSPILEVYHRLPSSANPELFAKK